MAFPNHQIDKKKVEDELFKRGWKRGIYSEWIMPLNCTNDRFEKDWTEALLVSIVCVHEQRINENKEFLEKFPTAKR